MHRQYGFHRLDLNDNQILDDQIDAIARAEFRAFVSEWNGHFAREPTQSLTELVLQSPRVGQLEETGAESAMDLNRGADDLTGDEIAPRIDLHAWKKSKRRAR